MECIRNAQKTVLDVQFDFGLDSQKILYPKTYLDLCNNKRAS